MADKLGTTTRESNAHLLLRLHQINYDIFRAETEEDITKALKKILKASPYVTAYYTITEDTLSLVEMVDPETLKRPEKVVEHIQLNAAAIAEKFSRGNLITPLDKLSADDPFAEMFSALGCTQIAFLPVINIVEVVGVFVIGGREGQQLDEYNLQTFISLADLLPIAYDKVKSTRAVQQRLRELETIASTSESISAANDINTLYRIIHENLRQVIGEVEFLIALYDAPTNTIRIPYFYEHGQLSQLEAFPMGDGLVSILIRTQQPLMLVEDTERRARALGARVIGQAAKSWLGCPLIVSGNPIGALVIQDLEHEHRFTQDDLRLLTSLSAQVAGAIYNARLLEEARLRALQLETAAEISRDVSASLIVDELLKKAVNLIRERFNFYHATVFMVEGDYAIVREGTGEAGMKMKLSGHQLKVGSKSIVGSVTATGQSMVVNDVVSSPTYYQNPLLPDTRAEAALPLKVGERVLGVIDVQSTSPFAFSDQDVKILQILADQLAVAIVNSELFAEAQERLSQHRLLHHVTTAAASSTTIEDALNSAVQGLQVTLGGDQIAILLANKEQTHLEVKASVGYPSDTNITRLSVPFGVGLTGWVAANRQPVRVGDVLKDSRYIKVNDRVRSELAIPLVYRNEVLGVLNVESPRVNAYSESDEEMLGTLGGSLAAIIAHSRLLEQFRKQAERERLLYETTSKIRRSTNVQSIVNIAANELTRALGARRARVRVDLSTVDAQQE
ncbi:MAG: GAF domain-containing protein [Anaerolineales bacterium]